MTTRTRIARLIDHTLLKPEATTAQVDALIAEDRGPGQPTACASPRASCRWTYPTTARGHRLRLPLRRPRHLRQGR